MPFPWLKFNLKSIEKAQLIVFTTDRDVSQNDIYAETYGGGCDWNSLERNEITINDQSWHGDVHGG